MRVRSAHSVALLGLLILGVRCAQAIPCDVDVDRDGFVCGGDCGGDGSVTVDDVIRAVVIGLGEAPAVECRAADVSRDGAITVDEIVGTVQAALVGCPVWEAPSGWYDCADEAEVCDVANQAGLDFLSYGKGVSLVDVDNDGWDDIWFSDSDFEVVAPDRVSSLYRSNGDGTFSRLDVGFAIEDVRNSWEGAFADYDNDGDADVLLVNGGYAGNGRLALYRNDVATLGRFTDVTQDAGIFVDEIPWWGASWADYDGDGWLDFVVSPTVGRLVLFRNRGDGSFEETAAAAGLPADIVRQDGKNPVWFDYDLDARPDLFIGGPLPLLFHNEGGGRFADVTGTALPGELSRVPFVFASAAADFDQDGWPDLYVGRFVLQDAILLNRGDGTFAWRARDVGLDMRVGNPESPSRFDDPDWSENSMGLTVADIDEDGWPDVLIGTGNPYHQFKDLAYCNRTAEHGSLWLERCVPGVIDALGETQTHGIAVGDLDRDGDADLVYNIGGMAAFGEGPPLPQFRSPNALFSREPEERRTTASLRFVGTESNRDAIGARFTVEGATRHHYLVTSTQGFQSQDSAWKLVALEDAAIAEVEVTWPDGGTCSTHVFAGERLRILEPAMSISRMP